jgi:5-methylcytosine-specific restriction endonuclease McrA
MSEVRLVVLSKRRSPVPREKIFARDHGVCCKCGKDCHLLHRIRALRMRRRDQWSVVAGNLIDRQVFDRAYRDVKIREFMRRAKQAWLRRVHAENVPAHLLQKGPLWAIDHIIPVWRGGGLADMDNLQTLCFACHKEKTTNEAAQRARYPKPKCKGLPI